jgi:hypothetical protein
VLGSEGIEVGRVDRDPAVEAVVWQALLLAELVDLALGQVQDLRGVGDGHDHASRWAGSPAPSCFSDPALGTPPGYSPSRIRNKSARYDSTHAPMPGKFDSRLPP